MLGKYKEIFFGLVFGLGAAVLDTFIDAQLEGVSLATGIAEHPGMMLYRCLFILFGLLVGWLLWQRNSRERAYRELLEMVNQFHHQFEADVVVIHARLQVLLTKPEMKLTPDAKGCVDFIYEKTRDLQNLLRDKLPKTE